MNLQNAQFPLLALALVLCGNGMAADRAADIPATPASASADAEAARADAEAGRRNAETARSEAETARRELEAMREQMRELSRKMAEVSARLGDVGPRAYSYRYLGDPQRAMIGVVLAGSKQGVRISAVTPGGPADKAGVRDGDIVVAVDGKAVASGDEGHDAALKVLHDLKLGQTVKLDVLRSGKQSEITVKAERREPYNFAYAFGDMDTHDLEQLSHLGETIAAAIPPDLDKRVNEQVQRAVSQAERTAERASERAQAQVQRALEHVSFSTPWWGLNLVSLNPDLGGYFGADRGVLVLSDSNDSLKGLKSGDVLLEVAGQKVERPEDALRLLREQPTGSDVRVQVLRQRKNLSLSMKAPEFKGIFVPPPPPPPPVPPVPAVPPPPAPPAPPAPPVPPTNDDAES
ncbi:MAG: PDZ domain-containing protein [Rudaea sp.]|nr:PDZ domain-containing protein [Rudaea sp.]